MPLYNPVAPINASYVTLGTNSDLTAERVLTGTTNQVILTDGGAGSTITLSLPQNIHTGATPTFSTVTLGAGTAAAPSVLLNSANTGLFSPGSNQFGASVNGTAFITATAVDQIGLNNTAPSTLAVFDSTVTTTSTNKTNWLRTTFNYNPAVTAASTFAVLNFTGTSTSTISAANIVDVTATCGPTAANALSGKNYYAYRARSNVGASSTLSSGTLELGCYKARWDSGVSANYTGGQINIVNYRVVAAPTGYTGSGSAMTYYGYWADEGQFVHNDNGGDYDARFEGDTDANLLFTDASTDRVGIGTNTPGYKLDVNGAVNAPGTTGNTYRWNAATTAPSTAAGSPTNYYGASATNYLGTPADWILVNVNGTDRKIPVY